MPISPQLETLAVPYVLYPGITFWMMPFSTIRTGEVIAELRTLNNGEFDRFDNSFGLLEGFLIKAEVKGNLKPRAKAWAIYLDARETMPALADRRNLFRELSAPHFINDTQRAFNATQDTTYDNTDSVEKPGEDASPEA